MFIGAYLCASGIFFALGVVALLLLTSGELTVAALRKRLLHFASLAGLTSTLALFILVGFWLAADDLDLGQPQTISLPGDLLSQNWQGWLLIVVALLGILSPLFAARWALRRPGTTE